jgi:3-deoxy-manno-octulosonate cytidylyltransferase (CMP-KDO synthetase)
VTGQKIIVIIPARMASSRYPGKPLAKILDLPMIEHVRRRALLAEGIDNVVVATCDQQIMDVVADAGGKAIMTSDKHERSTERIAEVMHSLTGDIVVVPQGDEPLLLPELITQVAAPFYEDSDLIAVSLLSPLEGDADYTNPNIVKAACDQHGYILFYSRAPIPYFQSPGSCPIYRETGVRAFRGDFLTTYTNLTETPFERVESVDMLRLLEHGYKIIGVPTDYVTIGVDHAEDVAKVEHILKTDPIQQALYTQIVKENL